MPQSFNNNWITYNLKIKSDKLIVINSKTKGKEKYLTSVFRWIYENLDKKTKKLISKNKGKLIWILINEAYQITNSTETISEQEREYIDNDNEGPITF